MTDDLLDLPSEESTKEGPLFSIETATLREALERAATVLPSRDTLPVYTNFLVSVCAKDVEITASNRELTVVTNTTSLDTMRSGVVLIPGKRLLDIVKAAGEKIIIDVIGLNAHVSSGQTSWNITLMSDMHYPDVPEVDSYILVGRKVLLEALSAVRYAAATHTFRTSLMMIDITDEGKVRATDGVRFHQVQPPPNFAPCALSIPVDAVDELVKLLKSVDDDTIGMADYDTFLAFVLGNTALLASKLSAEFPDVNEQVLKPSLSNDKTLQVNRDSLAAAIRQVRINADPDTANVSLDLFTDSVTVRARDDKNNTAECVIPGEYDGTKPGVSHTVTFNHVYLLDLLAHSPAVCLFRLGHDTKSKKSPLLLLHGETTALLHQSREW